MRAPKTMNIRADAGEFKRNQPGCRCRSDVGPQQNAETRAKRDNSSVDESHGERRDSTARLHDGGGRSPDQKTNPAIRCHTPQP